MNCSNCHYAWCWSCGQDYRNALHRYFGGDFYCGIMNGFFGLREIKSPVLRVLAYIFFPILLLIAPFIGIVICALYFVFAFIFFLGAALCGYTLDYSHRGKIWAYILQLLLIVPVAVIILVLGILAISIMTVLYYLGLVVFSIIFMYTWCCKSRRAYVAFDDFERVN